MKLSEILTYFTDTIFQRDKHEWRNPVVRWLVQQYKLLFYTARGLLEHGTIVRSAALTFYTLMSLVPIAAVVFAVVKGFGLADGLIQNLYDLFPQTPEVIDYLNVGQYYKNALRYEDFDTLFDGDPADVERVLNGLSAGQKRTVSYRARALVAEGKIDSLSMIAAIERALAVKLTDAEQ